PAFESWTITYESSSTLSYVSPSTLPANTDLKATIDIAPISQIKFVVTAKLKADVSSTIKNKATLKENNENPIKESNEVIANPLKGDLTIIKSVKEARYIPGGKLTYVVEVTNNNNILARDVIIKDSLNGILVDTNVAGISIEPFTGWKLISVVGSAGSTPISLVPAIGAAPSTTNIELKTNIKAKETITLTIEADVVEKSVSNAVPVGILENKATVTYLEKEIFDTVENSLGDPNLSIQKTIVSLDGQPFTNQTYKSGDEIVYEIVIENTGNGMATNVSIEDRLTLLKTELAGEVLGPAFESWSVEIAKSKPTTVITPISITDNSDIILKADIDVGERLVITVKAKINSKAVGTIPSNAVTANDLKAETPKVEPEKGELLFKKEILEGENYTQGGTIKYKLTITNTSSTY
ncbi:MAG: hypothetical protein ACRC3I_12020, partial [Cetobacterium sp.]